MRFPLCTIVRFCSAAALFSGPNNQHFLKRTYSVSSLTKILAAPLSASITIPVSSKMSILASQANSYLKESNSVVVSCIKNEKEEQLYNLVLSDCIFYPEGGGQPSDSGSVNGHPISVLQREDVDTSNIVVTSSVPFEVGSTVMCAVDWERRFDFMQQHTAQHLFSAVAHKLFKADTEGWCLGAEDVSVDLLGPIALKAEHLNAIESEVNSLIRQAQVVDWELYSQEKVHEIINKQQESGEFIEQQQQQQGPEHLLRGAPKGAALQMKELRMVRIQDLDINPCGGTHVANLAELQLLKITYTEKEKGGLRVHFVAGDRALSYLRNCLEREALISTQLSNAPRQHVEVIAKTLKDKKEMNKKLDSVNEELAVYFGTALAKANLESCAAAAPTGSGCPVIAVNKCGADLNFLLKAAATVREVHKKALVFISGAGDPSIGASSSSALGLPLPPGGATVAKAGGGKKSGAKAPKGATDTTVSGPVSAVSGPWVLFGDKSEVDSVKEALLVTIEARGGGRPGCLQGNAAHLERFEEAKALLENHWAANNNNDNNNDNGGNGGVKS